MQYIIYWLKLFQAFLGAGDDSEEESGDESEYETDNDSDDSDDSEDFVCPMPSRKQGWSVYCFEITYIFGHSIKNQHARKTCNVAVKTHF